MDSSQAKEQNAPSEVEKASADIFAGDIFAASRAEKSVESKDSSNFGTRESPAWTWRLPKIARPINDWTRLRSVLPTDFSADLPRLLGDSLAKALNFIEENPVEFLFLVERETNEIAVENNNSWWLTVGIETGKAEFAIEIDDVFAVWLVDALVGDAQSDKIEVRGFTPSEIAVLEFLALNLTHEANKIINAPLFKLLRLSREIPAWANRKDSADNFLLVSNWQTVHGLLNSIVKIYVTAETLKALNADENKLLNSAPRRRVALNALKNRVGDVRTRVFLGEAAMTLAEVAGLETGDVVLPENYKFSLVNGELNGRSEIFLGDAENMKIFGRLENRSASEDFEAADGETGDEILVRRLSSNNGWQIVVERFDETENPQFLDKSMANEEVELTDNNLGESSENELGEGGIALENLAVTLRVELEARRLSLAEVGNLRVNQVIELGAHAADPVNLLIDSKVVARGELVEVEDRLGVRIIQILR